MRQGDLSRLLRRLLVLGVLGCCLLFVTYTEPVRATTSCHDCDSTYNQSLASCYSLDRDCRALYEAEFGSSFCDGILQNCVYDAYDTYINCVNDCDPFPNGPPSGGGGGCGRGRTPCEQGCAAGRQNCLNNGGDTCGDDYQGCMQGCCP